jgi:hypothetical protein
MLLEIITRKHVSRSVGFLVCGQWVMLCAYAFASEWFHFIILVDSVFDPYESDHCMRCFWEECLRMSRERNLL